MERNARKRAVDSIAIPQWYVGNGFFKKYVGPIDQTFVDIKFIDPEYYILHKEAHASSFEEYMSKVFFGTHERGNQKCYVIQGSVGRGKSEFCNYMGRHILPKKHTNFFYTNIDCYNVLVSNDENSFLERNVINSITSSMLAAKTIEWNTRSDIGMAFYKARTNGVSVKDEHHAVSEIDNANIEEFFKFILSVKFEERLRILLVFDNMDECPKSAIKLIVALANRISDSTIGCVGDICVILPMREYTIKATATAAYPHKEVPLLDVIKLAKSRLALLADHFDNYSEKTTIDFLSTTYHRGQRKEIGGSLSYDQPSLIIRNFIDQIPSSGLGEFADSFMDKLGLLSGGNYKRAIKNLYYMLHSCRLNTEKIAQWVFAANESVQHHEIKKEAMPSLNSGKYIYDLLMCVHTPFFDYENSLVPNLYTHEKANSGSDYRDTLITNRILAYIENRRQVRFREIKTFFLNYGYNYKTNIAPAIHMLLGCGLVNPEVGVELKHLTGKTKFKLTNSGSYYLKGVAINLHYLQYVADATFMDSEFIIPIKDRYTRGRASRMNRSNQTVVTTKFIKFIESEEDQEKQYINSNGKSYDSYAKSCFVDFNGRKRTISERISIKYNL